MKAVSIDEDSHLWNWVSVFLFFFPSAQNRVKLRNDVVEIIHTEALKLQNAPVKQDPLLQEVDRLLPVVAGCNSEFKCFKNFARFLSFLG